MSIDKVKLQKMMAEMAAVGSKYGFKVTANGGQLSDTDAKIKFIVKTLTVDESGKTVVVVSQKAKLYAEIEGIDITKTFVHGGLTHRVIDYHPRKYKAPWITEASNGKSFKWPTDAIKARIGKK